MNLSAAVSGLCNSLKNFFQAIGNVSYAASQLLILIVLLKNGGFRAAGDYSLSQAIIAPIFGFLAFSLRPYWVSGVIRSLDMYQFFQLRIISIVGGAGLVFVTKRLLFPTVDDSIFIMVFTLKSAELISDVFYAALDVAGRSATAGKLLMGKALVFGVCGGLFFLMDVSIASFQHAIYLVIAFVLVVELRVMEFSPTTFVNAMSTGRVRLISLFHFISWASASSVVISVASFLPRYLLEEFYGRDAVGYYSIVSAPAIVVLMICTGLAQTELGKLSAAHARRDWPLFSGIMYVRGFLLAGLAFVAACAAAGLIFTQKLLGLDLIPLKMGYEISALLVLFVPLYLAQFLSYAVMPLARVRETFALALVSLLLQAAVSPLLIQWDRLYGAVAVSVVGSLVQAVGFSFLLGRYFHLQRFHE